jgi:hypothetical protein
MRQVTAYEAFGIFGDYDGNAPDTESVCLVATEDLAKEVCAKLNEDPREYAIVCVDGWEHSKRFRYRTELTETTEDVRTTLEEAMREITDNEDWSEEDEDEWG